MDGLRKASTRMSLGTLAALVVAVTALAGCGGKASTVGALPSGVAAGSTAKDLYLGSPDPKQCAGKTYTIGFDVYSDTNTFPVSVAKSIDEAAGKMGCVKVIKLIDNLDASQALANAQTFVQRKVDGVVLYQNIAAAQPGIMRVLTDAGIPVVATGSPAPGATFVSVSDQAAGDTGGKALAAAFKAKHSGSTPWVLIGALPDVPAVSNARMVDGVLAGIRSEIPGIPDSQVITIDTKGKTVEARARTADVMVKFPAGAPVLVAGVNDDSTFGMFTAFKEAGRADSVTALALGGAIPTGLQIVCQNPQYVATVGFRPDIWGSYVVPALVDRIEKKKLPDAVYIPAALLTRDNMKQLYPNAPC